MKKGVKRFSLLLLLGTSPLVFAEPISILQETSFTSPRAVWTQPPVAHPAAISKIRKPAPLYGIASWYSESDPNINLHTANGEIFDDTKLTCASWNFKFGTYLKITNLANQRSVVCRVNDRGPSKRLGRLIDLTQEAFHQIADLRRGLIRVSVSPIGPTGK